MCTAISFSTQSHYFGRNLDLDCALRGDVVITPRSFPLSFRCMPALKTHLAIIGTAMIADGYPLYYDATNETGLSIAALNFHGNARYLPAVQARDNIAPYELMLWLLGQCSCVAQARGMLRRVNLAAIPFSDTLPLSPLHFLISDASESLVIEPLADGLHMIDNPVGILTNNPPFDYHMNHLSHYMQLTSKEAENHFAPNLNIRAYSRGMGAIGLPGDFSSASRFIRAAFLKANSRCADDEAAGITQFFHILSSVRHVRGSVLVGDQPEVTLYSSCCNTSRGIYYYTTYENSRITAVDMRREDLSGSQLIAYPMIRTQQIYTQNA
ncbi:MAG: choloylglycine hydrolase [Clostridia bacterium]|nr:choloylglycine hydrolase [Clostridia bacterium]